jgi:hypothetical protein
MAQAFRVRVVSVLVGAFVTGQNIVIDGGTLISD